MKKFYLLILSIVCLSAMSVYAESPCDGEMGMKQNSMYGSQYSNQYQKPNCGCKKHTYKKADSCAKPCSKPCAKPCDSLPPEPEYTCSTPCSGFLCTGREADTLFQCMNLSKTQICNAMKINDKYQQEILSLNERIQCEHEKYYQLKNSCAKFGERHKQKRLVKKLEKKRKEICKCYEKQFEATLSDMQRKAYRKAKK